MYKPRLKRYWWVCIKMWRCKVKDVWCEEMKMWAFEDARMWWGSDVNKTPQTLLQSFARKCFYTQTLSHTDPFAHKHFYTQTLLHTDPFTRGAFHTDPFTQPFSTHRASELRVLLIMWGVCISSSHLHIFPSSHLHISFSHFHIFSSSHLHI